MEELIKALQIFLKYGNVNYPTHCEHDELTIHGYNASIMTDKDIQELGKLGFNYDESNEYWISYKYGSC